MVIGWKQKAVKAIKVEHIGEPGTSWRGAARRWSSGLRFGWGFGIGWPNVWVRERGAMIGSPWGQRIAEDAVRNQKRSR